MVFICTVLDSEAEELGCDFKSVIRLQYDT